MAFGDLNRTLSVLRGSYRDMKVYEGFVYFLGIHNQDRLTRKSASGPSQTTGFSIPEVGTSWQAMFIYRGEIYFLSNRSGAQAVWVYSTEGPSRRTFRLPAGNFFDIGFDASNFYVLDARFLLSQTPRVLVYTLAGRSVRTFSIAIGSAGGATKIYVSGGNVYVLYSRDNRIRIYTTTGTLVREIPLPSGEYDDLVVNEGLIYVLDTPARNERVRVYSGTGTLLRTLSLRVSGDNVGRNYDAIDIVGGELYALDDTYNNPSSNDNNDYVRVYDIRVGSGDLGVGSQTYGKCYIGSTEYNRIYIGSQLWWQGG